MFRGVEVGGIQGVLRKGILIGVSESAACVGLVFGEISSCLSSWSD